MPVSGRILSGATAIAVGLSILGSATVAEAQSKSDRKGEIVIAQPLLRQQFDPTQMVAIPDFTNYDMLFDGLLNLSAKGKEPALAESWTVSADGKQMDFKLRKGVKFHNGDAFSAEDVKFTFEQIIQPGNTHSYRQAFVESIVRVDVVAPDHARFILKEPWPSFFTSGRFPLTGIVPKKYYEQVGAKGFQEKPIGTGPYMLTGMKAAEWNHFEANKDYWGGTSSVKSVKALLVKEPFTRYAMLERGEADIVTGLTGPLFDKVKTNPKVKVFSSRYSGTSGMYFNKTEFPESADRRVRLAVAHAMNTAEIAKSILGGVCEAATSLFTPATFGFVEGLPTVPYDPAKARALLKEAGVQPGRQVSFTMHTESFGSLPNAPQVLEILAGNLEAVGFKVERRPVDTNAWMSMMRGAKQPSIFYGPSSLPDDGGEHINGWFTSWAVWSTGNIKVPAYDDIYKNQLKNPDLEVRRKLLQQFAKLESENLEAVPLFWCHTPFAVSSRIKNWEPAVASGYHMNFDKLELAD